MNAQTLWSREGGHNVSHLVTTLAQGLSSDEAGTPLADLVYQAFELACPVDDYESAAQEEGWKLVNDGWFASGNTACDANDWHDLCVKRDIEPHQREVYEFWIVSDWLADKLEAHGEKVERDFANLTIWGRTTTGQAVYADWVMEKIAEELSGEAMPKTTL